jgi:hypothetical protein
LTFKCGCKELKKWFEEKTESPTSELRKLRESWNSRED